MANESRCRAWAADDPLVVAYHDQEWCKISHDDRHQFEMLCLEGASVGLSWRTIINKRQAYREAFFDFEIDKCAALSDDYLESLLKNPGLIRNRGKIFSVRKNAVVVRQIIKKHGSFDSFLWSYTDGKQIVGGWRDVSEIPAETDISRKLSRDLKKMGMSYVGAVITYSFMQSVGMVNDHLLDCRFR